MVTKKCSRCKEEKDINLFGKNSNHDDNKHHYCMECSNLIAKEYRKKYHDKTLNSVKKYRENPNNRFKVFSTTTINDHRRNGYIVNIEIKDLENLAINTSNCIYCDTKLNYDRGHKHSTFGNSPSLDSINNEKNLNINNVQIICHRCNTIKHDMSHNEFINYCNNIVNKFGNNGMNINQIVNI